MLLSLVCCPLVLLVAVLASPEPNPEDVHIHLHGLDKFLSDTGGRESTNMQIFGGAPAIKVGQDYEDYGKKGKPIEDLADLYENCGSVHECRKHFKQGSRQHLECVQMIVYGRIPEVEKVWHPGILDARKFLRNDPLAESF